MLVHVTGDRIGDGLLKYPALRAFRAARPHAHITWVTARRPSVFAGRLAELSAGLIDEIHAQTGLGTRLFAPLPATLDRDYDVVVSTESRLRETLVLKRLRTRRFISPAAGFRLASAHPGPAWTGASAYERFTLLMSLAAGEDLEPEASIEVPERYHALAAARLPPGPRYAGLSPGAGGASKRWPLEHFIALARALTEHGCRPVFFLGPEDLDALPTIRQHLPGALIPERIDGNPLEDSPLFTIALARRLAFAVTNDSGGGHLIAAGGNPTLTIYGHTSASKFRSPYCEHQAVTADAGVLLSDVSPEALLVKLCT